VAETEKIMVQSQLGQIVLKTLSHKYPPQKGDGKVTQVVECLLRSLGSNSSTTKNKSK
jgi:hypothetical protein